MAYSGRASITPISYTSTYVINGQITPTEFLYAGDDLKYRCPSWWWKPSPTESNIMNYLPSKKQYLHTQNVPCNERVVNHMTQEMFDTDDEFSYIKSRSPTPVPQKQPFLPTPEIFECDDDDLGVFEDDDMACINYNDIPQRNPNLRFYSFDISYDHVYRCPRLWITGMDAWNNSLGVDAIMQDISCEHGKKTVTVETHPFTNLPCLSIHPCQHANMIRALGPANGNNDPTHAIRHFLNMAITIMPTADFVSHI